jgi:hypothetical protein
VKLVLLGQPADGVADLAAQLTRWLDGVAPSLVQSPGPTARAGSAPPAIDIQAHDALDQAPAWSTLKTDDLVLLLEGSPSPRWDWRAALLSCGQAFQVIHPGTHTLLQEVQWAIGHHLKRITGTSPWPLRAEIAARWQGVCETCSDPECEHRLFRRLVEPPRPPT